MAKQYNTILEVRKIYISELNTKTGLMELAGENKHIFLNNKLISNEQYTYIANEIGGNRLHVFKNVDTTKVIKRNRKSKAVESYKTYIKEEVNLK